MSFEPVRESITISKEKKVSVVSCEIEVAPNPSEISIKAVLSARAEMEDFAFEKDDGTVLIDGKLRFDCTCLNENGEIENFSISAQRKETVKISQPKQDYFVRYNVGCVKVDVKGMLVCNVDFEIFENEQTQIDFISPTSSGGYVKDAHQQYYVIESKGNTFSNVSSDEENWLGEICYLNARCTLKDVVAHDGYFIVDGEILCDVICENQGVSVKTVSTPFSEECICECKSEDVIDLSCKITKTTTERTGNNDGEKTIISFDVNFEYSVLRLKEFNYVADAFCLDCELLPSLCSCEVNVDRKNAYVTDRIDVNVGIPDGEVVDEILGACDFSAVACGYKIENGKLYVDGIIEGRILFSNENGANALLVSTPFSSNVKTCLECDDVDVDVYVGEVNAKLRRGSEIAIVCDLTYCVKCKKRESVAIISDFSIGDEIESTNGVLSIVIGRQGETLFDVARVACCDPVLISSSNPDVKFPLAGGERIIVFKDKTCN